MTMSNNSTIDKPILEYQQVYKEAVKENAKKYFDDLVKKSKLNVEENHKLVQEYKSLNNDFLNKQKKLARSKTIFALLIFLSIVLVIVGCVFIYMFMKNNTTWQIIVAILLLGSGIGLFIYDMASVRNIKNTRAAIAKKAEELANKKLAECYKQMECLNSLYDYQIPNEIFMKTVPSIIIDDKFKIERYAYMVQKFGLPREHTGGSSSILGCKSGQIQGNPFLILRTLNQEMYTHTYTGSAVHTYTTTERDSEGHYRTVTHTETVYANVYEPASRYFENEQLLFANPAAPDLTFSRHPTLTKNMNEKQLDKFIKNKDKENAKKEKKELLDDDSSTNYTRMSNNEFEALFNATDRNNETQFRLMFTPLAQQNMVSLIKDSIFGDDFAFSKEFKINRIYSDHAQSFPVISNPSLYSSYDVEESRAKFINFMFSFFNNLYFELAPILSIPLYQQTKPFEYIYNKEYDYNLSPYDHERLSNLLSQKNLRHPLAKTTGINKVDYVESIGNIDIVDVTNYSFDMVPQITYVPTTCRNGDVVSVPVHWFRYDPVYKTTSCAFLNDEGKTSQDVRKDVSDIFDNTDISFALKGSMFYNTSVAGFTFDRVLDRVNDYPQVRQALNEFKERYLKRQNENASVNVNKAPVNKTVDNNSNNNN